MNKQVMHNINRANTTYTVFIFIEIFDFLKKFVGLEKLLFRTTKSLGVKE